LEEGERMRIIDAEALEEKIEKSISILKKEMLLKNDISIISKIELKWLKDFLKHIKNAPTIEAKPVVHAHWEEGAPFHQCSNCNGFALSFDNEPYRKEILSNFCPHCGAQMDEGVKIPVLSMEDVPKIMEEKE
jgi:hypothetical protein